MDQPVTILQPQISLRQKAGPEDFIAKDDTLLKAVLLRRQEPSPAV